VLAVCVEDVLGPSHRDDAGSDHLDDAEWLQQFSEAIDFVFLARDFDKNGLQRHIDNTGRVMAAHLQDPVSRVLGRLDLDEREIAAYMRCSIDVFDLDDVDEFSQLALDVHRILFGALEDHCHPPNIGALGTPDGEAVKVQTGPAENADDSVEDPGSVLDKGGDRVSIGHFQFSFGWL
jgi:hypothetical protein